ncbi:MAG: hypothetical protein KDD61_10630 [Bdellovibrionales bacterium]|nr:hypothetical protein [Bdellovibrionales bacterium]
MSSCRGGILFLVLIGMNFYISCEATHDSNGQNFVRWSSESEQKALDVLSQHCASCHDGGAKDGGFGTVLDPEALVRNGYLIPENPQASMIYQQVLSGEMPTTYALSESEMSVLNDWIMKFNEKENNQRFDPSKDFGKVYTETLKPLCLSCHDDSATIPLDTYEKVLAYVVPSASQFSLIVETLSQPSLAEHSIESHQLNDIKEWINRGAPL